MKRYLTLLILIAAGTFIFGCRPRILKLNLPEEGAVKLEYLPMDLSPAYGLEVTDPEDIKEFIKEINQFSFYRYRNTALLNGEAVNVRISYEDGTHLEFLDMGTILRLSDGNWLKAAGDSPQISDYFRKNYNYYCRPKMKNLRLQERGIQKLEYEPAYLPAEYGTVITDRETIRKLADALSSFSCYLCTNPTGIRTPYGLSSHIPRRTCRTVWRRKGIYAAPGRNVVGQQRRESHIGEHFKRIDEIRLRQSPGKRPELINRYGPASCKVL